MKKIQQSQDQSQEQSQEQQNNQQDPNASQVEYFKIPVAFEIQGNYLGYLKFRRALSKSNKVINFDNEKITVNDKGGISSKGTLVESGGVPSLSPRSLSESDPFCQG